MDPSRLGIYLFAVSFSVSSASAQVTWTQAAPAVSPPARLMHAMAFDSQRGVVVMFGGTSTWLTQPNWLADTWEWDGSTWTQRFPAASPPAQVRPLMAYDSVRGRTVMLGSTPGEVWEWDGTNWIAHLVSPSPPTHPAPSLVRGVMSFDSTRAKVVLVDYPTGAATGMQTWEWDGGSWTDRTTAVSPPNANGASSVTWSAAFDGLRGRTVATSSSETWEWDGIAWSLVVAEGEGGLFFPMVFDSQVGRCTVHYGWTGKLWNGTYWIDDGATSGAYSLLFAAVAYDSTRHVTVQFGGSVGFSASSITAQTWERTAQLGTSSVTTFGVGCGNPAPSFVSTAPLPPAIGHTFEATITNASLGVGFVAWGTSNSTWGAIPLPLSLDPFGFEGCTLFQNGNIVLDAACSSTSWNTAVHSVPIPNIQGLVGQIFYLQAWTLQLGFNTNGIVTSNGIALTIGNI